MQTSSNHLLGDSPPDCHLLLTSGLGRPGFDVDRRHQMHWYLPVGCHDDLASRAGCLNQTPGLLAGRSVG
jgi:hypothetical protein